MTEIVSVAVVSEMAMGRAMVPKETVVPTLIQT